MFTLTGMYPVVGGGVLKQPMLLVFNWMNSIVVYCLHEYLQKSPTERNNRVIFVWPWNENAPTKQKQQTNGNRTFWLVYRTDKNACGFWLVKRTLCWKNFMPKNFLEINQYFALTSYYNTIGQSNNAFSILGFLWRENEEAMFWSLHPLADKTKNKHLPKPFFKIIRKSL